MNGRLRWLGWAVLLLAFLFLYGPIFSLMAYSFNESRLATVWSRFSTKWYGVLLDDSSMLAAAWLSLKVAFWNAWATVVLGTMAALALVRMRAFPTKTAFAALITAPLVMPDVIVGLSMLLLFVTAGDAVNALGLFHFEAKGVYSILIAHITFSVAYVTVVIASRMAELDKSLEEAAMDLGANRAKVFFQITLPIISPALVSGWLLAFTLSIDDVVIASFVSGPGSTTLPIKVFSSVRRGLSPEINALATILVVAVSVVGAGAWWWMQREEKRRQRDIQLAVQANG